MTLVPQMFMSGPTLAPRPGWGAESKAAAPSRGPVASSREAMSPMRDRAAGAQRRGDQHRLGELGLGAAGRLGPPGMDLDAVRALRRHRHGDGDQLVRLRR